MNVKKKIREVANGEEIELHCDEITYYLKNSFLVNAIDLQVCRSWDTKTTNSQGGQSLRTIVRGVLEPQQKLSVIGVEHRSINTLTLEIQEADIAEILLARKVSEGDALGLADICIYVSEGEDNQEIWFLKCRLPKRYFESLVEIVESGKLANLNLRLFLNDLYTDQHWMDSHTYDKVRYIKPIGAEIDIASELKTPWGHVEAISFWFEKLKMERETRNQESIILSTPDIPSATASLLESNSEEVIAQLRSKFWGCVMLIIALIVYIVFK